MSYNFDDNNNENNKNISIIKSSKYESSSPKFDMITISPVIANKFLKELLQELNVILLNTEFEEKDYNTHKLNLLIDTLLLEYDLDSKNVLKIMISNSENIICFSSLIGYFYQHGIECKVDEIKAFEIFSNAIKNNQKALLDLISFDQRNDKTISNCYHYGVNVEKNYNKAFEWYSKSSEGGNIKAMYKLGILYECGYGVIKDKKKAFKWYLKSAKGGYKLALYKVGYCCYYGKCTFNVGNYYHDGKIIPKDEEKWFYWNRKAAINGYAYAQYKLAEYYITDSINKNEDNAFKWYTKLANKNWLIAIYMVAKCYRDGIGIDKNSEEAMKWIKKYELSKPYRKPQIT
ncbi:hypothetical protein RclHR1_00150011 [Rhizophagus clarus]|uniref:HCP-like protein n=1 Tax=Rhizophagus clarus TaxID=94130 RepID=A0A2Z6QFV2_9GLOM|nr:hypothetical protein RclHR1_00150011 [Rhizophagus clarus]